jgi:hypothetical protein
MAINNKMDFRTNKIKQNSPGLTYENPQALTAKFSNLGAFADVATQGIETAREVKDQYIDDVATDAANQLSEDYLAGSETYTNDLAQRKLRLEDDLSKDAGNSTILAEIDVLNEKLVLAQEQGRIGPGEMKHRMMTKAAELTSNNPAYQEEISNRMNAIFNSTGVNDIIASDSALLKARQSAAIARRTEMVTEVEKYIGSTAGMDNDTIANYYGRIKNITADTTRMEFAVKQLQNANEKDKEIAYQKFKQDGGFKRTNNVIYGNLQIRLKEIAKNDTMNIDDKLDLANATVQNAKTDLGGIISSLPKGAIEAEILTSNLMTDLQRLQDKFLDRASGANVLTEVTNHLSIQLKSDELNVARRLNLPELEAVTKISNIVDSLRGQSVVGFNNLMTEVTKNALKFSKGITVEDPISDNFVGPDKEFQPMQIATASHLDAVEDIKKNGKLDDSYKVFYTSAITLPASSLSGPKLLEFQEQRLRPFINTIPESVLKELVNDQNFSQALNQQLNVYTETTRQGLYAVIGDAELNLSANRTNNTLFVSAENNPELGAMQLNQVNDSLRRITDIAIIDNKISKSSEMSEPLSKTINDLLAEFFPNVNLEKK